MDFNKELKVVKMATLRADRNRTIASDLSWLQELNDAQKEETSFLRSKKKLTQSIFRSAYAEVL